MRHSAVYLAAGAALAMVVTASAASAQVTQRTGVPAALADKLSQPVPETVPADYTVGVDDVLSISVWGEKDVSGDVIVRPDGKITLVGVGDDIMALGLTTEELKSRIVDELKAKGYFDDPTVSIQVKAINSRNVFVQGAVAKQGKYALMGPTTISMIISEAGGLLEFAKKKDIMVIRNSVKDKGGQPQTFKINYSDIEKGKNLPKYNILLLPGDVIIIPQ